MKKDVPWKGKSKERKTGHMTIKQNKVQDNEYY